MKSSAGAGTASVESRVDVLSLDEAKVVGLTQAEIKTGADIQTILNEGLIAAMDEVGSKFSAGDLFVPEMLMAAQAMKAGLEVVSCLLQQWC